jgi:protein-tyrosine phosphatase
MERFASRRMITDRPIPDSYWLIEGQLLAGEYPGSWTREGAEAKLALFLDAGIRSFIDLTRDTEPIEPYDGLLARLAAERNIDCRYQRLSIDDMGIPSRDLITEILAKIVAELDEGRPVYVHCWGGIGRTGAVAGCWLVEAGVAADEALTRVRTLRWGTPVGWKRSPETDEQCDFVRAWKEKE